MAVMPGVRPKNIASSGWGVIFTEDANPAIREALSPLLKRRRDLATRNDGCRYREYAGRDGLMRGESKPRFMARHGIGPGPVNPRKVPYYLMLVGGPEKISFNFQHQLGIQHAVGRLAFDTPEEYDQYARNVVEAETSPVAGARRAGFFGVQNSNDLSTLYSLKFLHLPLVQNLSKVCPDWQIEPYLRDDATKAQLGRLLGGEDRPTLLFTTSHSMGFPRDHERHRAHSGALLCQDWPGPQTGEEDQQVSEDYYFSADDLCPNADLRGMMTFHFASYGAGVPEHDALSHSVSGKPRRLASRPFVCRLPQRLLAHPRGALAFIGQVDQALGFSCLWLHDGDRPDPFEAVLKSLMGGEPVGHAMRFFGDRYAQSAADLEVALGALREDHEESAQIFDLWTTVRDSRSYALLGDPAVRLMAGC